jgi:hypothetical protein
MYPDAINPDSADMDKSVADDTFWSAAEMDQRRWLKSICTEHVAPTHTTKEIVKGITLNHLQMERLIGRLNVQNGITATAVKRLTWFAVGLAALQVVGVVFFVWRDFSPRKVTVDKSPDPNALHQNEDPKDVK